MHDLNPGQSNRCRCGRWNGRRDGRERPATSDRQKEHRPGPVGSVIEIWSTDPVTKTDIGAWSAKVGHEFLGAVTADGYDRVFVRRGK